MAEASGQNANGQGAAPAAQAAPGQAGANQNGGAQGAAEPKWISYIPETEREEARKGWMMESDYRKKTEGLTAKEKAWEAEKAQLAAANKQYQEWWTGFEPVYKQISDPPMWAKIEAMLTGKPIPGQQAQQQHQNGQDDLWNDFDILPPAEQAKRYQQFSERQYAQKLTEARQEMEQRIQQAEQRAQNYLAIMTDAFARKANDPSLDVPAFIQKQLEYSMGKFNPGDLAYKSMTAERDMKKMQDEWMQKGREEAKLEFVNQQQSNGAGINPAVLTFKQPPMKREEIGEAVRKLAVDKGIPWNREG